MIVNERIEDILALTVIRTTPFYPPLYLPFQPLERDDQH